MSERKHIDRLFQEKFKDFEATPNEAIWRNISAKLQEKERRRPIVAPIWSRVAGIAAVLAIIFLIGEWMFPVSNTSLIASEDLEETFDKTNLSIADNSTSEIPAESNETNATPVFEKKKTKASEVPSEVKVIPLKTPVQRENISSSEKTIASTKTSEGPSKKETLQNKKSLFDAITEPEIEVAEGGSKGNFEVSTHAAPIYYGNFGNGNFLGSQFSQNSKESEITYSYGINIAYSISDKVKIRSGVNKVSMSYNTSNIAYNAIVGPAASNAIALNEDPGVEVNSKGNLTKQPLSNTTKDAIGRMNSGLLNQKMGFIEVPVELEYNLIDKRFELNLIGGASTLFLDENKISVNDGNISAVGKANNLNQVSFSTNIGLGLDYNLSEKFKLNMEPMLKYQFNTFNSQSSGNQPYYLGIYSGFSFKF
ncbi:outer membrane beta-barrel protein [Salinimicrobium gaetbulicola]|uniref:Outer membrane beta-barrel protein n=1 Tax=Salinimicrobium gaetbulicola TaxID=999702 RepID=A0ABW3IGN5_9FLAO